ncbi:hypothetical protein CRM22_011238 [Opisthorchis felineus]|uniref:Uncharacterized protein n=1 Tax=Opisthorchis felineus TaxID=147828 RepID=A0A4S2K2U6_OPIFE|nr:hypothetical protein CRM22_011238 [Opisthorchis felineus]
MCRCLVCNEVIRVGIHQNTTERQPDRSHEEQPPLPQTDRQRITNKTEITTTYQASNSGSSNPSDETNKENTEDPSETVHDNYGHSLNYTVIMSVTLALTGATLVAVIILICNRRRVCKHRFWMSMGRVTKRYAREPIVTYQRFE